MARESDRILVCASQRDKVQLRSQQQRWRKQAKRRNLDKLVRLWDRKGTTKPWDKLELLRKWDELLCIRK